MKKRKRWNKKKFARNVGVLLLMVMFGLMFGLGIIWGLDKEMDIQSQKVQNHLLQIEMEKMK